MCRRLLLNTSPDSCATQKLNWEFELTKVINWLIQKSAILWYNLLYINSKLLLLFIAMLFEKIFFFCKLHKRLEPYTIFCNLPEWLAQSRITIAPHKSGGNEFKSCPGQSNSFWSGLITNVLHSCLDYFLLVREDKHFDVL